MVIVTEYQNFQWAYRRNHGGVCNGPMIILNEESYSQDCEGSNGELTSLLSIPDTSTSTAKLVRCLLVQLIVVIPSLVVLLTISIPSNAQLPLPTLINK